MQKNVIIRIIRPLLAICICFIFVCENLNIYAQTYYSQADNLQKSENRETIKVGYFASDGYHMVDEYGIKSGYGYDFLKIAENYNNWKFEYVGFDKGWQEMLTMLSNGDIDMLTYAQKTEKRQELYDYSDSPIGTSADVLLIRSNDTRYSIGDPTTYKNMTIGIERGTTHEESLYTYAHDNDFEYTPVYFDNRESMKAALDKGSIDAMISNSFVIYDGVKVLSEMNPIDFYVIVKKGNTELMGKINSAISQMDLNTPGWRMELKNKYFYSNYSDEIMLDRAETEYLNWLNNNNIKLKVVTNPDLAPYSYYENGSAHGIAAEIFEEIANRVGIPYEYVVMNTYEEYNEYVKNGNADIDLTCFSSYGLAEYHGLELSNSYMSTSLALLSTGTHSGDISNIAEIRNFTKNTTYNSELADRYHVDEYDTYEECIKAVLDGDSDATYMYTYQVQKAVEDDIKNRLTYSILPEYNIDIAIGVKESTDYRLLLLLNKGITSVKGSYAQHVIQNQIDSIHSDESLIAFIYDYPYVFVTIVAVMITIIFMIICIIMILKNRKKEQQNARELSRLMRYICQTNDKVVEIDLNTHTGNVFSMSDTGLSMRIVNYENNENTDYFYEEDFNRLKEEEGVEKFWDIFDITTSNVYFETRTKEAEGSYKWYSYSIQRIPKDELHPNNIILFKKDINATKLEESKQKQLLEDALLTAQNASAAKGNFLSRMSHEIRTPLNAVIGYMDIASNSKDNISKIMHCIENSDVAAKHLLSIINDILDISSIENGKMKIAHEEFDLKKMITAISTMFFNQAKSKQVEFEAVIEEITEEWIVGDSLRLNQILMNLLSNAVKFTPENGKVTLFVQQVNMNEKQIFMKFVVSDTGIGMSEEYKKRLFKPFEQENATTAQKYGGTGLGLSITYNLIQMMNGSVEVQSELGKGTTFVVSIGFDKAVNAHDKQEQLQDYSHVRVLIVDDDESACEYMKSLFKRCKVKCDVVQSGTAAIKQIKRRLDSDYKYDMCIIDWNMPQLNGIETAKLIKEECDPNMPIIIATAYDITEFEDKSMELGVERIISKPLFQSTMFDLLVSIYGKYSPVVDEKKRYLNLKGMKVLLAEDNPMNQEIAVEILQKAGLEVDAVADGKSAVEAFTQKPANSYDAILMDIQMPIMNGYEATAAIRRSEHAEASTIPIIAMTANAFAEDVNMALANGMNGHISKPVDYDKLYNVLSSIMSNKER